MESLRVRFPGKDDPEKVKRGIADAREKLGAQYVMLVGDASLMAGVAYRDGHFVATTTYRIVSVSVDGILWVSPEP